MLFVLKNLFKFCHNENNYSFWYIIKTYVFLEILKEVFHDFYKGVVILIYGCIFITKISIVRV